MGKQVLTQMCQCVHMHTSMQVNAYMHLCISLEELRWLVILMIGLEGMEVQEERGPSLNVLRHENVWCSRKPDGRPIAHSHKLGFNSETNRMPATIDRC